MAKREKQTSRTEPSGHLIYDKDGAENSGGRTVYSVNGAGSVRWCHWGKLVSTSQESTVDFVRIDISIVVMFLKHGLLC